MPVFPNHKQNPDAKRRKRQSSRLVRILRVHHTFSGSTEGLTVEDVLMVAQTLGVSDRTI